MSRKQYIEYISVVVLSLINFLFVGNINASWNQWSLINNDFWATNPTNTQIVSALFGAGTPLVKTSYTKIWDNYSCSSVSVQTINPWTNTLPVSLAANTIYVLNSWNYIISSPRSFAGNCTAIIWKWEVTIFSSTEISQMLAATWTARNNIIVDNIKFDGKNNGAWWTHVLINRAIEVPYWYNVTINNSQFYNFQRPLYFWYGINALYNSQIFNNDGGGTNSCQTSWPWTEQPMINSPWHLNINNCLIFNNNNFWLLWTSKSIIVNNTQIFNNKRSSFFGKSVTTEWVVFNNVMIYNNLIWLRLDFDYTIFNDVYLFNNNHKYNSLELSCWITYSNSATRNYYIWSKSFYTTKNGVPTLKIFNHFNSDTNFSWLGNGERIEDYNFSKDEDCWSYFSLIPDEIGSRNSLLCSVIWNWNYVTDNILWRTDNIAMDEIRWNLLYWEDAVLFWDANTNANLSFGCHMLTEPNNTLTWLYKWVSCNKNTYDWSTSAEKERLFSLAFQSYGNREATPIIRFTYGTGVFKQKNPVYWKTWLNNTYWTYTWLFYYWISGSDWDSQKYIGEVQRLYPITNSPGVNNNYRWYKIMWINIFGVINTGQFWHVSTNASFSNVREFGICKIVTSTTNQVFIPTKTLQELNSFLSYTPMGIIIEDCIGWCYNDSDCLAGQVCQWETTGTSPYCQWTFSVPTTTYSCQSDWVATPSCWENGYQIMAGDIDDCTLQWGTPGFYFKGTFYNAMMACMMDENSSQRSDLICPYPCSSLNQSQCTSPGCTWTSSTTNQTYNCNQAITTTTARCTGKEVPLSEQHCYNTNNWNMIAAPNYWECQSLWYARWFYFNSIFYNASNVCMMEAWENGEIRCFYPCRWLTQAQCTAKPTQCSRTTTTTTVSPNECWDRPGCSRNLWTSPQAWTCTIQTCWTANDQTYASLTSTNSNLCNIWSATNFVTLTSSWTWNCWTNSCSATKATGWWWTIIVWWCFKEGTQVSLSDGTTENIENIQIGDVLMWSENGNNKVLRLFKLPNDDRKMYSINNSDYFVTDTHPFMTTEWWKSFNPKWTSRENPSLIVSTLNIGDIMITNKWIEMIYSIDSIERSWYVYNFMLDNNSTYYADWYLVHNIENPSTKLCSSDNDCGTNWQCCPLGNCVYPVGWVYPACD
jgi:hypothetical protein